MRQQKIRHQKGFTFIELIIVIILLGILAAIALPKFANLTQSARLGTNKSFAGALSSAVNMAHASWVAKGSSNEVNTVSFESGVVLHMNASGWPDSGTSTSTGTDADCVSLWNNTLQDAPKAGDSTACTATTTPVCYQAVRSNNSCVYTLSSDMTAPVKITYTYAGAGSEVGKVIATP